MDFSQPRQRFYQAIHPPDDRIDLALAALCIAQEEYPELDIEAYLNTLDTMAAEVREQLPAELYPLRVIRCINRYLYEDLGFAGNRDDYYDPRNSFLNEVIERRTGIPIALSLLYLEIAKRIEFPMEGIGMPGHFLIRPVFEESQIYVDAFNGGEVLFPEDCRERLSQVFQQPVELRSEFFQPVSSRQFLARMLTNLKGIYLSCLHVTKALGAIDRILLLFPDAPIEVRDRGLLYYHLDRLGQAKQDLERYLELQPQAEDAVRIAGLLDRLQEKD
ncbi:SirB1 family protein [Oscillatoriales cyanobacterium LEGE 11467]|uniref:SirB1 family protein n=1 Tax=Zarconia navalis LEGE 11467 TaxID=1828826 RepID=A0A928VZ20_9CYAN|nr:SirB1 family protein [Zarconia navalis]MBE9040921.1 SirB1 family protein [Zarconia navalis LEGE 11467]